MLNSSFLDFKNYSPNMLSPHILIVTPKIPFHPFLLLTTELGKGKRDFCHAHPDFFLITLCNRPF
jgi:hypothetical protein